MGFLGMFLAFSDPKIIDTKMDEIKETILNFMREYYVKHGKPPSVELMSREVEGLSRRKFYKIFRGGIAEACNLAGIPQPRERIKATAKARKEKKAWKEKDKETEAKLKENRRWKAAEERKVQRLEKAVRQLEISTVMGHLMVMQLDSSIEISRETMRLYLEALSGGKRKLSTFREHVLERYFASRVARGSRAREPWSTPQSTGRLRMIKRGHHRSTHAGSTWNMPQGPGEGF